MLQKLNITKRQLILTALLIATFMLPFVANISTADALGNYECFTQNRKQHVSCLRAKLDSTPHGLTVPKAKDGMGIYGCFDRDRRTHVTCLRSLLDEHGPHLAKGAAEPVPPTAPPTVAAPPAAPPTAAAPPAATPAVHHDIPRVIHLCNFASDGVANLGIYDRCRKYNAHEPCVQRCMDTLCGYERRNIDEAYGPSWMTNDWAEWRRLNASYTCFWKDGQGYYMD